MDGQSKKIVVSLSEDLGIDGSSHECPSAAAIATFTQKNTFKPHHAKSVPKSTNLEVNAFARQASAEEVEVTTMMLRNIPSKYTQSSLVNEIQNNGFEGTFDFFYLPMDIHNRSNVGYAFINFLSPQDAERFREAFSGHTFARFNSKKVSSVNSAHLQGLLANLRHFENRAVTHAANKQYRPMVFLNGRRVRVEDVLAQVEGLTPRSCAQSDAKSGASNPNLGPTIGKVNPPSPVQSTQRYGELKLDGRPFSTEFNGLDMARRAAQAVAAYEEPGNSKFFGHLPPPAYIPAFSNRPQEPAAPACGYGQIAFDMLADARGGTLSWSL
eukprot:gb/GFBE01002713.1/.p1 GENE.gb/GFBE01002713.1/~~gb/GFBE01002713.1/.p1  ORF type:complete len:326 (+),score=58.00 gb/GFBE01002713.1/:1-978(+)